jgi:lipopolysaccharide/colanic/teichoic acid biosynthesis glycosyltransferase
VKRALDLTIVVLAVPFLLPTLAIAAMLVRWRLGSPVLFRQLRLGLAQRPFELLKFRTMRIALDQNDVPLPDHERWTSLGRVLRQMSLDELPQLWNVVRGDMSLVGPRPLLVEYASHYTAEQNRRHDVKPGITGWAQINGRNAISWDEKFRLDLWYVDHQSIALDVRILFLTAIRIFRGGSVNASEDVTMPRFDQRNEQ